MMAIEAAEIEKCIVAAIPDAQVTITALKEGGDHYKAHVVSESFRDVPIVTCHRKVYAALQDALKGPLHALSLTTEAP